MARETTKSSRAEFIEWLIERFKTINTDPLNVVLPGDSIYRGFGNQYWWQAFAPQLQEAFLESFGESVTGVGGRGFEHIVGYNDVTKDPVGNALQVTGTKGAIDSTYSPGRLGRVAVSGNVIWWKTTATSAGFMVRRKSTTSSYDLMVNDRVVRQVRDGKAGWVWERMPVQGAAAERTWQIRFHGSGDIVGFGSFFNGTESKGLRAFEASNSGSTVREFNQYDQTLQAFKALDRSAEWIVPEWQTNDSVNLSGVPSNWDPILDTWYQQAIDLNPNAWFTPAPPQAYRNVGVAKWEEWNERWFVLGKKYPRIVPFPLSDRIPMGANLLADGIHMTPAGYKTNAYTFFDLATGGAVGTPPVGGGTPPSDTTKPTGAFTAPAAGATIGMTGSTTWTINATDNVGVVSVTLEAFTVAGAKLGNVDVITTTTGGLWTKAIDNSKIPTGTEIVRGTVRDAAGNYVFVSRSIVKTSNTNPATSVTFTTGAFPAGAVTIVSGGAHESGVSEVSVWGYPGGHLLGISEPHSTPGYYVLETTTQAIATLMGSDTIAQLETRVLPNDGPLTASDRVAFTTTAAADNEGPVSTISAPANGATVSGLFPVAATAVDVSGVDDQSIEWRSSLSATTILTRGASSTIDGNRILGATYLEVRATDTVDNVGAWARVNITVREDVPETPAPTGDTITPRMFSGWSDVPGADNTAPMMAFLEALKQPGAGRGELPGGTIYVRNLVMDYATLPIQPDSGAPFGYPGPKLSGAGKRKTIIKQITGTPGDVFRMQGRLGSEAGPGSNNKVAGATFSDFVIQGNPSGRDGLHIQSVFDSTFTNVDVEQCGRDGMHFARETFVKNSATVDDIDDEYSYNNHVTRSTATVNGRDGFHGTDTNAVDVTYFGCEARRNKRYGFTGAHTNSTWIACKAIGQGEASTRLGRGWMILPTVAASRSDAGGNILIGCRSEGTYGDFEIEDQGGTLDTFIANNLVQSLGADGYGIGLGDQTALSPTIIGGSSYMDTRTYTDQKAIVTGPKAIRPHLAQPYRVIDPVQTDVFAVSTFGGVEPTKAALLPVTLSLTDYQGDNGPAATAAWSGAVVLSTAMMGYRITAVVSGQTSIDVPAVAANRSGSYDITLVQGPGGAITWSALIRWLTPNGKAPVMPTAGNARRVVVITWTGTEWQGTTQDA